MMQSRLFDGEYAPLASGGMPGGPATGFEGMPGLNNPMLMLALQPVLASVMGQAGLTPMGLHDRNVADIMQQRRFYQLNSLVQAHAAEMDRASWMNTMRGMAHMTGTPWGAEQRQAARGLTDALVSAAPMMSMMFPDLMDELGGRRGSATVLAGRMAMASRYRVDPVTGLMGQTADTVKAQHEAVWRDLYETGAMRGLHGVTAGQMGQLYEQLTLRGQMPGDIRDPRAQLGGLGLDYNQIARGLGIQGPGAGNTQQWLNQLSPENMDKLLQQGQVSTALRTADTSRIKQTLKDYTGAVTAVKEIFGDMGRPDAPMSELLNALDKLTNGSMAQLDPHRLSTMVRNTRQLANMAGVGMDQVLMLQEHASSRVAAGGAEPIFGVQATQGGLAFRGAYDAAGWGRFHGWGRFNAEQATQADVNLRANVASSVGANRIGAALRLADTLGAGRLDTTTDAGRYLAALRAAGDTGQTTWVDSAGNTQQLYLDQGQWEKVMGTMRLSNGQSAGVTPETLNTVLNQRFANREFLEKFDMVNVLRGQQWKTDVAPAAQMWTGHAMADMLRQNFAGLKADPKQARRLSGTISEALVQKWMDIGAEGRANMATRNAAAGEVIYGALSPEQRSQLNDRYGGEAGAKAYLAAQGGLAWEAITTGIQNNPQFSGYRTAQNMFDQQDPVMHERVERQRREANMQARVQDALAPINRGGALRRAMDYLQNADVNNSDLPRLIGTAMGGISEETVTKELLPTMRALRGQQEGLENTMRLYNLAKSPEDRRRLMTDYNKRLTEINKLTERLSTDTVRITGRDPMVEEKDINAALYWDAAAQHTQGQLAGRAVDFNKFWASDQGETYAANVVERGRAYENLATRVASSDKSMEFLGTAGVEAAADIRQNQHQLLLTALDYTHGNLARLEAGDFQIDGDTDGSKKKAVMARVQGLIGGQREKAALLNKEYDAAVQRRKDGKTATLDPKAAARLKRLDALDGSALATKLASVYRLSDKDRDNLAGAMHGQVGQAVGLQALEMNEKLLALKFGADQVNVDEQAQKAWLETLRGTDKIQDVDERMKQLGLSAGQKAQFQAYLTERQGLKLRALEAPGTDADRVGNAVKDIQRMEKAPEKVSTVKLEEGTTLAMSGTVEVKGNQMTMTGATVTVGGPNAAGGNYTSVPASTKVAVDTSAEPAFVGF